MSKVNYKEVIADAKSVKAAQEKAAHESKVKAWLASRPEVGVLTGPDQKYYKFTENGRFIEIKEFATH